MEELLHFMHKIGYQIDENTIQHLDMHHQQSFDFTPDMAMFSAAYTVKKSFFRQTTAPKFIKNSICFFFRTAADNDKPYIRVFPFTYSYTSSFKKNSRVQIVSVLISAEFLKSYLLNDTEQFQYLFETSHDFVIEEIMTDDILRTVNDIAKPATKGMLSSYYYKLKAMELLFYLFQSLRKREKAVHQKLNKQELSAIYKVRDTLIATLDKPTPIADLKQIAGMNELKVRKLFIQVFGMGIYDYFQHMRMQEAARLIREEKRSVSETGYQMGFENLSHFSRVFEKHIGKKPKKYSSEVH